MTLSRATAFSPRLCTGDRQFGARFGANNLVLGMQALVLLGAQCLKVFGAVIVANLVDVVDMFSSGKSAAIGLFPIQSMLKNVSHAPMVAVAHGLGVVGCPDVDIAVVVITLRLLLMRQLVRAGVMAADVLHRIANVVTLLGRRARGHRGLLAATATAFAIALDDILGRLNGRKAIPMATPELSLITSEFGATAAFAKLGDSLIEHLELILSGVAPRAVVSSAGAFCCPNFTAFSFTGGF